MGVWTFFGIALLWDWNETWLFQSCDHCWTFQICWHIKCSSGFPYFLLFKSEFWNKELTIWAIDSSRSCFYWVYRVSSSSTAKNITKVIELRLPVSVLAIWWCPCVESSLVDTGCSLWPVYSLGKTLLTFALPHFVLQGQTCLLLQVSLDFLFLLYNPLWWKGHLFWCYF